MKVQILSVSSKPAVWLKELAVDYQKKISFWIPTEVKFLKAPSFAREAKEKKINEESELLIDQIKTDDWVILCDESGQNFNSLIFAKQLERIFVGGKKRALFIVGGAYGVNDAVKTRADLTVRLSPFTLNHQLAMAVLLEQIFRGMTIIKGAAYHNE